MCNITVLLPCKIKSVLPWEPFVQYKMRSEIRKGCLSIYLVFFFFSSLLTLFSLFCAFRSLSRTASAFYVIYHTTCTKRYQGQRNFTALHLFRPQNQGATRRKRMCLIVLVDVVPKVRYLMEMSKRLWISIPAISICVLWGEQMIHRRSQNISFYSVLVYG